MGYIGNRPDMKTHKISQLRLTCLDRASAALILARTRHGWSARESGKKSDPVKRKGRKDARNAKAPAVGRRGFSREYSVSSSI